jgi:dethiobiotin synthetase
VTPLAVPGLFVTGTDTGVGKTFVSVLMISELRAAGLTVGAYKPACSGVVETPTGPTWEDIEALDEATGRLFGRERIGPQRFLAPLAPPVAAKAEGRRVDAGLLRSGAEWWRGRCDVLIVEGAGGLLCPLTETETFADLAVSLGLPVLIVARATLGTINHTLLTIEAARRRGLTVVGVVLNEVVSAGDDASIATNADEITARTGTPVLGVVPHGRPARLLPYGTAGRIDWRALTG